MVARQFFLGDRTRLQISGIGDAPVTVETTEHREFRVGEEIGFKIDPETLLTLRD